MRRRTLKVLADWGYFSAPETKANDDTGITALVPKSQTSGAKADGCFYRADFVYIAADDEYQCPVNQRATYRFSSVEPANLMTLRTSRGGACPTVWSKASALWQIPADSLMGARRGTQCSYDWIGGLMQ
jgi:hypothetical protein